MPCEIRCWRSLEEFERIQAIYNYVRDEILFGYNTDDSISASMVLADGYGQCNTNADYYGTRGVVIKKEPKKIVFENPGYIHTGKIQMRKGGECLYGVKDVRYESARNYRR